MKFFRNKFGDNFLEDYVPSDYQLYSSDDVILQNYSNIVSCDKGFLFINGTDSGLLFNYVYQKRKSLSKDVRFVFFEFDDVIKKLGLSDKLGFNDGVGLFKIEDDWSFYTYLPDSFIMRDFVAFNSTLKKSSDVIESKYHDFEEFFRSQLKVYVSSLLIGTKNEDFEQQAFINLPYNQTPARVFENKFNGLTAVILGGGPSLDESIDWVKSNRDKVVIFAVGRLANRLIKEKITPDFIGSVDPYHVSYTNARSLLQFADKDKFDQCPILLNSYHINNKLLSQWGGPAVYLGPKSTLFPELNIESMGPTVSHALVYAAIRFGFQKIIFSGIDLCFPAGKTHESASEEAQAKRVFVSGKNGFFVTNNLCQQTATNRNLYEGHQIFEELVAYTKNKNPRVCFYTLGAQSAKIAGVDYVQQDVFNLENDSNPINPSLFMPVSNFNEQVDDLNRLKKILEIKLANFNNYLKISEYSLSFCSKKLTLKNYRITSQDINIVASKHSDLTKAMVDDLDYLVRMNTYLFKNTFLSYSSFSDNEKRFEVYLEWFKAVAKLASIIVNNITSALTRVEIRLVELQYLMSPPDHRDIKFLEESWRSLGHLGRVFYIENNTVLSNTEQSFVEGVKHEFYQDLSVNRRLNWLKKNTSDPKVIWRNLQNAFESQDSDVLNHVVESITESENIQRFDRLAKGMLAFINSNFELAKDCWSSCVLELEQEQQIFCLQQLLELALAEKDLIAAMGYVEKLCQFSLVYMKTYAKILDLLGNASASAEVLGMYLNVYQDDLSARLKLAELYYSLSQTEQALTQLDWVLKVEPTHKTALHYKKSWI